jgi:hypothetical protein
VTLLNLGRSFEIAQEHWLELCQRIEEIVQGQVSLLGLAEDNGVERAAAIGSVIARMASPGSPISRPVSSEQTNLWRACSPLIKLSPLQ